MRKTQKDVNIYKQLEEIEENKAKRKMKMRLIYGFSSIAGVVIIASLFIDPEQVKIITELIDTILKYLPWG